MFARSHRFSFRNGVPAKVFSTPNFIIRYDKNDRESLECAVVVGKKVDKRAVARNRIKRQIVALIKEILDDKIDFRIVIYAKKSIIETSIGQKKEELEKIFTKTNILK